MRKFYILDNMKIKIELVRAIGSEFVNRKLKSIVIVFGVIALISLILTVWLATISAWWLLLLLPFLIFTMLGFLAGLAARVVIKTLRPELTRSQKTDVGNFVDKLERVAENIQTPMFIIVFRVVRDIIRPGERTFVRSVAKDSTTLHKDFSELEQNFKN